MYWVHNPDGSVRHEVKCGTCGLHAHWIYGQCVGNPPPLCPRGCDDRMAVTRRKLVRLDLFG